MNWIGKNCWVFIFDVFTPKSYEGKSESNIWYLSDADGFWQAETYLGMQSYYIYENKVTLDQYVIVDKDDNVNVYRMWNQCYTKDTIIHELKSAGFEKIQIYSDVTGKLYNEESKTMCIVVEKWIIDFAKEIMMYLNIKTATEIDEWYRMHKIGFYPQ